MKELLLRALRKQCPACGKGNIFEKWNDLKVKCDHCAFFFEKEPGDTWGFMYVTTGFLTGVFIIALFFFKPTNTVLGRVIVFIGAAILITGSLQIRKSFAVAINYFFSREE